MIFYFFSFLAILGGSLVIVSRNSVRAVLCLVMTFFAASGLWLMLEAEFLAVTLVLVYVGAVMVLFLFVVMMLDIELAAIREGFARYLPLGLCVSVLVVISLVYAVGSKHFGLSTVNPPIEHAQDYNNVKALGEVLYTQFLYPFLLAGVLLLVAIIAAIGLAFRGRRDSKAPNPEKQVEVKRSDRIRLVAMETSKGSR
jgi:NADH-quinone oxidoreductase subunit J